MQQLRFPNDDKGREQWLASREGKVTGTSAGKIFSKRDKKPLKGFYEIIAERVAVPASEENRMDRGIRLEDEAVERFSKETGKVVDNDLVLWQHEEFPDIAVSPDGSISDTEALEVKCLNSASHIEAYLTKEVPSEYEAQVTQYFVVNPKLETLYFVFYDPRMTKDFFYLTITRESLGTKITESFEQQVLALKQIEEICNTLTF